MKTAITNIKTKLHAIIPPEATAEDLRTMAEKMQEMEDAIDGRVEGLSRLPMGTIFRHDYLEFDDESEVCILISAGDASDGDFFRVRYLDLEGNAKTMWVSDDDSVFTVGYVPVKPMSLEYIDRLIATKVYWLGLPSDVVSTYPGFQMSGVPL